MMTDVDMQNDGFTSNQVKTRHDKRRRRGKRVPVSFASDVHGMNIRNAATGSFYDERVGTLDERKFFKVSGKSTFKMNSEGVVLDEGYNMSSFYYDTPEQYEQHKNVVLAQDVKDKWYSRECCAQSKAVNESLQETSSKNDDNSDNDEDDINDMINRLKNIPS